MDTLSIGAVAKQVGVGAGALRYYERLGLLLPSRRTASGYRVYQPDAIHRLRFIRRTQALGFSLEEIATLLRLVHNEQGSAGDVKSMVEHHIQDLDTRIRDLQAMRGELLQLAARCDGSGKIADCPIVAALDGGGHGAAGGR